MKKAGLKQYAIANLIGVNKSKMSREFKRNIGLRGYRPQTGASSGLLTAGTNLPNPYLGCNED
ncbi:MAG: IS30 family transposase [Alteromonas macleodii]